LAFSPDPSERESMPDATSPPAEIRIRVRVSFKSNQIRCTIGQEMVKKLLLRGVSGHAVARDEGKSMI
jgi:hypothetical protein